MEPSELRAPVVLAPLAGGPATVPLAAAVSEAGGLGFLASGYRSAEDLAGAIEGFRRSSGRPFGVNVFAPPGPPARTDRHTAYVARLDREAAAHGVELGEARRDDDDWQPKLDLLEQARVPVVSFVFGCPPVDAVAALRSAGSSVWVTVTTPDEARQAAEAGADALVVQGVEAGGHRASFVDDEQPGLALLPLLQLAGAAVDLPLVAAGGVATGRGLAAVLAAGAVAAQIGTAFLRCPEAGTARAHRDAIASSRPTALTRAFSGRLARGVVNRFMLEHDAHAPAAYPEIHHVTSPLRAAAREAGDADSINLWAGQAHELAREEPAGEVVSRLVAEARAALAAAAGGR